LGQVDHCECHGMKAKEHIVHRHHWVIAIISLSVLLTNQRVPVEIRVVDLNMKKKKRNEEYRERRKINVGERLTERQENPKML